MKNVIILYDLIAREYWASNELKKQFEKYGNSAEVFSLNFEYYKAINFAKKKRVDLIFIPSCYSKSDYQRVVMPFKKLNYNMIVVCMHSEQIGYEDAEEDLLPTDDESKNTMYHLSWGNYFTEVLNKAGVNKELILEYGNLRLQEHNNINTKFTRENLSKTYNLDINKEWIIYCDSGTYLFYQMYKKGELVKENLVGAAKANKLIKQYSEIFLFTIEFLNSFSDEFFEKYELIYRPHPGINDTDMNFLDSRIKAIRDCTVYTWFRHVICNIVFQSTTIFESDMMGVISLVLQPQNFENEVIGVKEYAVISAKNDLENILTKRSKINVGKRISEKYMGVASDHMIKDFVEAVLKIDEDNVKTESSIGIPINIKKVFTSVMVDYAVRFLNYANILKHIKFPRRFDMNKYEHPIFKDKYIN